jgi:hypothetical protein
MLHKTTPVNRLTLALSMVGMALALVGAGCLHPPPDEMTNAVVSGEKPVAMEGGDVFFGGRVAARVTLSRGIGRGLKKGARGERGGYSDYADNENKTMIGNPLPPVTLHLLLTNTGSEPITVTMVDFVSDLGNFAVDPDTLTLAPGQTAEPSPMVSQLGVSSDEIAVKVALRLEKAKEARTITLRIIHAAPAPAAK